MKKHLCLLAAFLLMALPSVPAVRAETPSAVSFARAEYWIAQKAVKEISILVEPEDAEDSYNVTVSDPAVLEAAHYYDERFKLKGLKPGDVTLALDTESGLHAECTVHVTAPVTEIRFTEENVVITRGQSHQFTVVATTEDGREYSNELVTFLSDPFYLSVDENGLATGVREWNTHIRADAGKVSASVSVLVIPVDITERCIGSRITQDFDLLDDPTGTMTSSNPDAVTVESFTLVPGTKLKYRCVYACIAEGPAMLCVHDKAGFDHYTFLYSKPHDVVTDPAVEPTYDHGGLSEGSHCARCRKVLVPQDVLPALERPDTAAFEGGKYRLDHDAAEAVYTGPENKNAPAVAVPDSIHVYDKTYKVTEIGAGACRKMPKLKKLSIGKNVRVIGKNAFLSCAVLKTVTGGAEVAAVGDSAFSSCKKLANLPDLAKLQTVGAKAFRDCAALKSFTVGSKVKQIGKEAFSRCKSLKSLTILTKKLNAKNVGKKAFEGLNAKVKVRCPKGKAKAYEKLLKACGLPATATVE